MLTHAVLGADNKELKKIELSKAIFASPIRRQLLFDCTQIYLANKRQGTVKAKDRGEISRTTKKVYRQKGTGNARHGSLKAGVFVGGGAPSVLSAAARPTKRWRDRSRSSFGSMRDRFT